MRGLSMSLGLAVATASSIAPPAASAACEPAPLTPTENGRDAIMADAKRRSHSDSLAEARALYLFLLARDADDDEARTGVARVNAWDGCYDIAESDYRKVLARHPRDTDARAGLVDVLFWQTEWDEAGRVLEAGLALSPRSPELLARRARLSYFRGDAAIAARDARLAEAIAPDDVDLRAMIDRIFVGEARLYGRVDVFPAGFPNLYTGGLSVMQSFKRFRFVVSSELIERVGGSLSTTALLDWRRTLGVFYTPGVGVTAGLEISSGTPAKAIAENTFRLSAQLPIGARFTGSLAYSLWLYPDSKTVHIFAPAIGFAPLDSFRIEARWYTAYVVLAPPPASNQPGVQEAVHSAGLFAAWRKSTRFEIGGGYTYGVQLDQNPALYQLVELRSHVVSVMADWLIERDYGIRPLLGAERRETKAGVVSNVFSFEMGAYVRW